MSSFNVRLDTKYVILHGDALRNQSLWIVYWDGFVVVQLVFPQILDESIQRSLSMTYVQWQFSSAFHRGIFVYLPRIFAGHFSCRVEQSVRCLCVCVCFCPCVLWVYPDSNFRTKWPVIGMSGVVIHRDQVLRSRSKLKVTGRNMLRQRSVRPPVRFFVSPYNGCRTTWSWYSDTWWADYYVWYSKKKIECSAHSPTLLSLYEM